MAALIDGSPLAATTKSKKRRDRRDIVSLWRYAVLSTELSVWHAWWAESLSVWHAGWADAKKDETEHLNAKKDVKPDTRKDETEQLDAKKVEKADAMKVETEQLDAKKDVKPDAKKGETEQLDGMKDEKADAKKGETEKLDAKKGEKPDTKRVPAKKGAKKDVKPDAKKDEKLGAKKDVKPDAKKEEPYLSEYKSDAETPTQEAARHLQEHHAGQFSGEGVRIQAPHHAEQLCGEGVRLQEPHAEQHYGEGWAARAEKIARAKARLALWDQAGPCSQEQVAAYMQRPPMQSKSSTQMTTYKQFCDNTSVEKKRVIEEPTETFEDLKADICMYKSDAETLTKEIAGQDSDIQFAAYKQFCDNTSVEKKSAIEEPTETFEALKADICMYKSDAETRTKEIAGQDSDIQSAAHKQFCDNTSVEKKRAIEEPTETFEALKVDICMYKSDAETLTKEIAGHDSDSQFAAYKQFCENTLTEEKSEMEEATETFEVLNADISKYKSVDDLLRGGGFAAALLSRPLRQGDRVRAHGLVGATHLNGATGSVLGHQASSGRHIVLLTRSAERKLLRPEPRLLKPENLHLEDAESESSDDEETEEELSDG